MTDIVDESARRRAALLTFLRGLSEREKLVALDHLANDVGMSARLPDFARTVAEMHRARYKCELLDLTSRSHPTLELALLARRKGCRLERAEGPGDRWRIIDGQRYRGLRDDLRRLSRERLTRRQALEVLRTLPDRPPDHGPAASSKG